MHSMSSLVLASDIRGLSTGVATYLASYLDSRDDFGMRSFYGEAFALALLGHSERLTPTTEQKLLRAYHAKDRDDSQFHWEFNHYAMLEAGRLQLPLTFKHTPVTNWTLLRANVRIRAGVDERRGLAEATRKLRRMQRPSGLILDDRGVKSFQYHCFSAAMTFELYRATGKRRFLDAFCSAVAFIRHFILPNGDALYIGRGQQQSFGYASLIYILSAAYSVTTDTSVLADLQRVIQYVRLHARQDGSLPLVMGGGEEPLPHPDAPHRDCRYPGWYAYNNYFDYLPFAGLFLWKAAQLLSTAPVGTPAITPQQAYRDKDFLKIVVGSTIAVISRPGGYWTNDLPVPYVYCGNRVRTSCYGGEQFGGGIYSLAGIPLPIRRSGRQLRWRAASFLWGSTLVMVSPLGVLLRRFVVSDGRVEMHNRMLSPLRLRDRYLLPRDAPLIRSDYPLVAAGTEYCALGTLTAFEADRIGTVILEFPE